MGSGANEGQIVFTATFDTAAQHATWFEGVMNDSKSANILAERGDHDGWTMQAWIPTPHLCGNHFATFYESSYLLGFNFHGGIAQLVEHLHGMQGVRSSNLLTSTKSQALSR